MLSFIVFNIIGMIIFIFIIPVKLIKGQIKLH